MSRSTPGQKSSFQAESGAEYRFGRPETATTSFFEEKYKGPDAVMIDITEHGWVGAQPPMKKTQEARQPD